MPCVPCCEEVMKFPKFVRRSWGSTEKPSRTSRGEENYDIELEAETSKPSDSTRPDLFSHAVGEIEVAEEEPSVFQTDALRPPPEGSQTEVLEQQLSKAIVDHQQERQQWDQERNQLRAQLNEVQEKATGALKRTAAAEYQWRKMDEVIGRLTLERDSANSVAKLAVEEVQRMRQDLDQMRRQLAVGSRQMDNWVADVQEEVATRLAHCSAVEHKLTKYDALREQNKTLYNQIQDFRGNIRVFCRIRPPKPNEELAVSFTEMDTGFDQIEVMDKSRQWKSFTFDKVLQPALSQDAVYTEVKPLLRSVLDGFPVCIFAYGQTSSGKTYTMSGPAEEETYGGAIDQSRGLTYRALDDLFALAEERKEEVRYTMYVQMLEIYNETIRDLLAPDSEDRRPRLDSSSSSSKDIRFVDGVPNTQKVAVSSSQDVVRVMDEGNMNRAVGATALNTHSSRSHSVVTVCVEAEYLATGEELVAKLQLVDLAGSERVGQSQAQGDRLKEAQYINRSLSALGDVVSALQNKNPHVPYRNSRLTTVLQDSLGGGAKSLLLLHISPEVASQQESLSTLQFGVRAASVERPTQVKSSAATPMSTSQMKRALEDLSSSKKELDMKNEQVRKISSEAAAALRDLDERSAELRKAQSELRVKAAKLESRDTELAQLRTKVAELEQAAAQAPAAKRGTAPPTRGAWAPPRTQAPAANGAKRPAAANGVARDTKMGKAVTEKEEQMAWGGEEDPEGDEEFFDSRNAATVVVSPASGTVRQRTPGAGLGAGAGAGRSSLEEPASPRSVGSGSSKSSSTPSTVRSSHSSLRPDLATPDLPPAGRATPPSASLSASRSSGSVGAARPTSARGAPSSVQTRPSAGAQTHRDRTATTTPASSSRSVAPGRPTPPSSRPNSAATKPAASRIPRPTSVPPQDKNRATPGSAQGSRIPGPPGPRGTAGAPARSTSTAAPSTSRTPPSATARSASALPKPSPGSWAAPSAATSRLARPKSSAGAKPEAKKSEVALSADRQRKLASVTADSEEYSRQKEREAFEAASSSRRDRELQARHEKLKKQPPKESKIKHINDLDTLLQEAEKQLQRLATDQTEEAATVAGGGGAGGDGKGETFLDDIGDIARKLDKAEADASSSGALTGKNEPERVRIISACAKLQGLLESDDIASTDIESRVEKQKQIKRAKALQSSLEMAGMSVSWSGGGGWSSGGMGGW